MKKGVLNRGFSEGFVVFFAVLFLVAFCAILLNQTNYSVVFSVGEKINSVQERQIINQIDITSASHLDSNRNFVKNIFPLVFERDYESATISSGEFVRVIFEKNLSEGRDITIYAESTGISSLEVYEKDSNVLLMKIENISNYGFYKKYFTNWNGFADEFDLKVSGDSLKIDYITDPLTVTAPTFIDPTPANATSTTNRTISINVTLSESNLKKVIFDWNGTNYSFYEEDLVLFYNFDNRSELGENSTYVTDLSMYGNNASLSYDGFSPDFPIPNSTGKYAGSWQFRSDGNYLDIPDSATLDITNTITLEVWIKQPGNGNDGVIFKGGLSSSQGVYSLVMGDGSNPQVHFRLNGATSSGSGQVSSTSPIPNSEWVHLVATYDGSVQKLYVNGILNKTESYSSAINTDDNSLKIGCYYTSSYCMEGNLDGLRIYNRSLSADEVYQHYSSNLARYNLTDWELYINKSRSATQLLSGGNYEYQIFATDLSGNSNQTEERSITISVPSVSLSLISPTAILNNATKDVFFNVTVNVSCFVVDCGQINVTLDPVAGDTNIATLLESITLVSGTTDNGNVYSINDSNTGTAHSVTNFGGDLVWNFNWSIPYQISSIGEYWGNIWWWTSPTGLNISYWDSTQSDWVTPSGWDISTTQNSGEWHVQDLATPVTTTALKVRVTSDSGGPPWLATDFAEFNVSGQLASSGKDGVISMNSSATPFYTNVTNPYNLTLNAGESRIITWWVLATGNDWSNHTFFAYANKTGDPSISATTNQWNVTILYTPSAKIDLTLATPSQMNVLQYNPFFNFTFNVSCLISSCNNINATLIRLNLTNIVGPDVAPHNMSGDTTPVPYTVTYSSQYLDWGYKVFDGTTGGYWLTDSTNTGWIAIDLGSQVNISQYKIQVNNQNEATRAPRNWTFDGSTDGSTWVILDTVVEQESWASEEIRTFICDSCGAYRHYRVNITQNNGDAYTQLAELYLNQTTTAFVPVVVPSSNQAPFYINTSNPSSFGLGVNQSSLVTLWLNATGDVGTNHTFYLFVNQTSNFTISNSTSHFNVSITAGGGGEADTTVPSVDSLTSVPASGQSYSLTRMYEFNASVSDAGGLDKIFLEVGGINYTAGAAGSVYNVSIMGLGAGSYTGRWFANDTSGNANNTITFSYTVNTNTIVPTLYLNGTEHKDMNVTYPSQVNASANSSAVQTLTLYRNGADVTATNNQMLSLPAGYYNYTATVTANNNYSASTITRFANITKGTPTGTISGNGTFSYPTESTVQGSESNSGDGDVSYTLFRDGVAVSNPETSILGVNGYNYKFNATEGQNWTAVQLDSRNLNITQNTSYSLNLTIAPSLSINSGTESNASGSNCPDQITCVLTVNGTSTTNPEVLTLGIGYYNYNFSSVGNANYSFKSVNKTLTVSAVSVNPTLYLNGTEHNMINGTYPTSINISTNTSTGQTLTIYRNGVDVTATNNQLLQLPAGYHNITVVATANEVYSASTITRFANITKGTPTGSISGTGTVTYPTATNVEGSESNSGDGDVTYTLFRDGVAVSNPESTTLGAGTYAYKFNATEGQNWTAVQLDSQSETVNVGTGSVSLFVNSTEHNMLNLSYLSEVNASANSSTGTITLYRNGVDVTAGMNSYVGLGVGYYNFTAYSINSNYTTVYLTRFVNFTKISSSVSVLLNGSALDLNITTGTTISVNATRSAGEGSLSMYMNGTLFNTGNPPLNNNSAFNDAGYYNFTAFEEASQNYTSSYSTLFLNVTFVPDESMPSLEFVSPTETDGSNYTRTNILVNVTASDNSLANITIRIYNSTTLYNSTNSTSSPFYLNFSDLIDGTYRFNASASDGTNVNNSATRIVIIDNGKPSVVDLLPVNGSQLNTSQYVQIAANVSDSLTSIDSVLANVTSPSGSNRMIVLSNVEGTKYNSSYLTSSVSGRYNITIISNDSLGNTNNTQTSWFNLTDVSAPNVTIVEPTSATKSSGSYTINITLSEAGYCVYSLNSGTTNSSLTAGNSDKEFTGSVSGASDGSYTLYAYCNDSLGNRNDTIRVSFSISTSSGNGNSNTGGSSSGGDNTGTVKNSIHSLTDSEFMNGASRLVVEKGGIRFYSTGEYHLLTLNYITYGKAVMTMQSKTIAFSLNVGESKNFDFDSDGFYDARVTVSDIKGSYAEIKVQQIEEEIKQIEYNAENEEVSEIGSKGEEPNVDYSIFAKIGYKYLTIGIIAVLLIVLLIIIYLMNRRR